MRAVRVLLGALALAPTLTSAAMEDDPLLGKVTLEQFEVRAADGPDPLVLQAEAWVGKDLHKLWLDVEAERVDTETEEAELQVLYHRAIAPHWNLRAGWRRDWRPEPQRDWLALGIEGVAPYWIEVDARVFVGRNGRGAARLEVEYELLFTQQWILSPELELNLYSRNDEAAGIGAGLADLDLGLRLRYEIVREVAPYVGVNWHRAFGRTADFARDAGADTDEVQLLAGLRAWF